jgi:hypothetical protein
MNAETDDSPFSVDAVHTESPKRKRSDDFDKSGFLLSGNDFRLEQQPVGRPF